MQAVRRIVPQPREHRTTSTPKTRFSNKAQSRRYVDGTDVDCGDAAGDDGGDDGRDDGDGDVVDTCGSAGGSAPSLVDAGRGTTLLRRRLVGATTPCRALIHHLELMNCLRFAYVGRITGTSFSSNSTPVITSGLRPSWSGRFMSYAKRPSTGAHHDATKIVIVGGIVGDEDTVVVEGAVGNEHVKVHVQQ